MSTRVPSTALRALGVAEGSAELRFEPAKGAAASAEETAAATAAVRALCGRLWSAMGKVAVDEDQRARAHERAARARE